MKPGGKSGGCPLKKPKKRFLKAWLLFRNLQVFEERVSSFCPKGFLLYFTSNQLHAQPEIGRGISVRDLRGLELRARRFHLLDLTGRTGLWAKPSNLRL